MKRTLIRLGRTATEVGRQFHEPHELPETPNVVACCIYRLKNEQTVQSMIDQLPEDADIRLHAFDKVSPALAGKTRSHGQGARMPLLRSLIDSRPVDDRSWLLLFDDDAMFEKPGRSSFLAIALRSGFDLVQPAISHKYPHSFNYNVPRILSIARRTTFVEVGPVVAFSPTAWRTLLPFPETARMGWGVDVEWACRARAEKLSLGVVDWTPIIHLGPVGVAYDDAFERSFRDQALKRFGLTDISALHQKVPPYWRIWQKSPPWMP